jgi:hypothetical protein
VVNVLRNLREIKVEHEDMMMRVFACSLGAQRDWLVHSCKPRCIPFVAVFIKEFLKQCGPTSQKYEDTCHDLLIALQEEAIFYPPHNDQNHMGTMRLLTKKAVEHSRRALKKIGCFVSNWLKIAVM